MAKKLIGSMLSNYLKTLPKFSDKPNEDAVQWLNDITNGLNYAEFTDDRKVSIISGYVDGDARSWLLRNVSALDSWPIFIQEFQKVFAPALLKEGAVSSVNQCVHVLDETMIFSHNDFTEEQKCELLQEKEVNLDDSSITLVEFNYIVSTNTYIVENSENNCESVWPDGHESWFLHDALPQRCHFIRSKQPEVPFNSTSKTDDTFAHENLSNCINVLLLSVMNDKCIAASYDIEAVGNLFQLNAIYNDVISFFLFFGELPPITNTCRRIFSGDTSGSYLYHDVVYCYTEDRDWFRLLTVP